MQTIHAGNMKKSAFIRSQLADFFIFPARIVCICTYSMVSKHETFCSLVGMRVDQKVLRQLRISTLWTSKGYGKKLNNV